MLLLGSNGQRYQRHTRQAGDTPVEPEIAPVLDPVGNFTYEESQVINPVSVRATDVNADIITIEVTGLPSGLSYANTTQTPGETAGTITGTVGASAADSSPYTVTITATDDSTGTLQSTQQVTMTVTELVTDNYINISGVSNDTEKLRIRWKYDSTGTVNNTWDASDAVLSYDEITMTELDPFDQGGGVYKFHIDTDELTPNLLAAAQSNNGFYDMSVSALDEAGNDSADDGEYASLGNANLVFSAPSQTYFRGTDQGGGEYQVVVYAHNYHESYDDDGGTIGEWVQSADGTSDTGQVMTAASGSSTTSGDGTEARLLYYVDLPAGTYQVSYYHKTADGSTDSWFGKLGDSVIQLTTGNIGTYGTWRWRQSAEIVTTTDGEQVFTLYRREQSAPVGAFVIHDTAISAITGSVPAESAEN